MDKNTFIKELLEWVKELAIVLVVAFLILTFVIQNTKVIGESMEATLQDGNQIIMNKFIYRFTEPKRGDIIVFPYKGDPSKNYIKRVIGLPGEKIEIVAGKLFINGKQIEENYIREDMRMKGDRQYPFTVPANEYFVMGDNRNNSQDSRYMNVGTIPKEDIIGKASLRVWPLNKIGLLD